MVHRVRPAQSARHNVRGLPGIGGLRRPNKKEAVMKSRNPNFLQVAAVLLVLFFSGCKAPDSVTAADKKLADRLEKLATLPADIEATLDPRTNATKTTGV